MDFEATYKTNDEDEDGDRGGEAIVKNVVVPPTVNSQHIRILDLDVMHAAEFSKYANIGVANPEDGEFRIRMEYSSIKSVIVAIRSYIISRGVDYIVYESKPQMFYANRRCDT
ncbi:hypothetical protein AHAS_Ahas15G0244800 [Arachis hypogaea]